MKTTIAVILAALAISFAIPACSKKGDDDKKTDEHTDHTHK